MGFPNNFYFGASTSAHQVEGGNVNDWTEWEKQVAPRLASIAESNPPAGGWPDHILNPPAGGPNPLAEENYISGQAVDHYNRFEEDFALAKELGHNAHRFSIEWSRIELQEGVFDEREIAHYKTVVSALRARNIEPFVTLWHWTVPLWFREQGGWASKKAPAQFVRYAERMAKELPDVRFWITLNETNVYTGHGYLKGAWPPNRRSLYHYLIANHHLSRAHIAAYKIIKKINPTAQVGIAHNVIWFTPLDLKRDGLTGFTHFPARLKRYFWNHFFLKSLGDHQDFVGINYYLSDRESPEKSDMGWSIDPNGFYLTLKDAARHKKPIYVLENGIADARDTMRAKFIEDHLAALARAITDGVDVRGYFYWSLLDNFEWAKGFWPRFGLIEIDYRTMQRKTRPSALVYKKIIERGGMR